MIAVNERASAIPDLLKTGTWILTCHCNPINKQGCLAPAPSTTCLVEYSFVLPQGEKSFGKKNQSPVQELEEGLIPSSDND